MSAPRTSPEGLTNHECPGDGCTEQVPSNRLMCRADWYRVPKPLRDAVWNTWRSGAGAGTTEHTAAILAAIGACNRRRALDNPPAIDDPATSGGKGPGNAR